MTERWVRIDDERRVPVCQETFPHTRARERRLERCSGRVTESVAGNRIAASTFATAIAPLSTAFFVLLALSAALLAPIALILGRQIPGEAQ
jgi:hypothetical protein